jgi:hypothetical protein
MRFIFFAPSRTHILTFAHGAARTEFSQIDVYLLDPGSHLCLVAY